MDFLVVNDGLRLCRHPDQLPFGTDALLLAAFLKAEVNGMAADLGSGSGCLALLAAKRGFYRQIYAVEMQEHLGGTEGLIAKNIRCNALEDRVHVLCTTVQNLRVTDFPAPLDAVFTNPPYFKQNSGKTNCRNALTLSRHEICGDISDFCYAASRILRFGGSFFCVYRPERIADLICAMRMADLELKRLVLVCTDTRHAPSLLLAEGKKGGHGGAFLPRTLYLRNADGQMTEEYRSIYEEGTFHADFFR